jgi:transcriptional regulator with XRE-family HTH domain
VPTELSDAYVLRRKLGDRLRELRQQARLTLNNVADHLGCRDSKVSKIENARLICTPHDLACMCEIYDVDAEERARLEELADRARRAEPPWWRAYGDVITENYAEFLSYETAAVRELEYQTVQIPSLFQTEDYARAVTSRGYASLGEDQIDALVEVRMTRQNIMMRDKSIELVTVITEAALHFEVGGRSVLRAQLRQLLESSELPNVTLLVIPYRAGADGALTGGFTIFQSGDNDLDVGFSESVGGSLIIDDRLGLRRLFRLHRKLTEVALSQAESQRLIAQTLDDVGNEQD